MAVKVVDSVVETTQTTGTGTLDLDGAQTGFRSFADELTSGDQVYYCVEDDPASPTAYEIGIGTFTSGSPNTLSRDLVLKSSNSGNKLNLVSGGYVVTGVLPGEAINKLHDLMDVGAGSAAAPSYTFGSDLDTGMFRPAANTVAWATGGTERARIESNGRLLVGTTTAFGTTGRMQIAFAGSNVEYGIVVRPGTDTTRAFQVLNAAGSEIGSISQTSSAVAYNTSSDYRLKDGVMPLAGALDAVARLKPCRFYFRADPNQKLGSGFLAHELAEVLPEAVTGEKDAVDENGNIVPQQIDYAKLTPLLAAALQEAAAKIAALEERLAAAGL